MEYIVKEQDRYDAQGNPITGEVHQFKANRYEEEKSLLVFRQTDAFVFAIPVHLVHTIKVAEFADAVS